MNKSELHAISILDAYLEDVFIALYTVAPTATDYGVEVDAEDYVRVEVAFGTSGSPPVPASRANASAVEFPVAESDWGTIVAIAIVSGEGFMFYFKELASPVIVNTGDQLKFLTGDIVVTEG